MILGVLVVVAATKVEAWGHAWSEIHDSEHWLVADSTQPLSNSGVQAVFYLPVMQVRYEGPGHRLDLLRFVSLRPNSVTLVASD